MFKYGIVLKPIIAAGGVEHLEPAKRTLFDGLTYATAKAFECAREVENVDIREDFTIVVTANEDVFEMLKAKLHDNVIISRLSNE